MGSSLDIYKKKEIIVDLIIIKRVQSPSSPFGGSTDKTMGQLSLAWKAIHIGLPM